MIRMQRFANAGFSFGFAVRDSTFAIVNKMSGSLMFGSGSGSCSFLLWPREDNKKH